MDIDQPYGQFLLKHLQLVIQALHAKGLNPSHISLHPDDYHDILLSLPHNSHTLLSNLNPHSTQPTLFGIPVLISSKEGPPIVHSQPPAGNS